MRAIRLLIPALVQSGLLPTFAEEKPEEVSFSRDILPILSDRCFHCHGPDPSHRKADLRLDLESEAKKDRGGYFSIDVADWEASDIWDRIITEEEDDLMPPPDSHRKPISKQERAKIASWLKAGAPWGKHWSFEKPVKAPIAKEAHPIDFFVGEKLHSKKGTLSPKASPATLVRRLSLALKGLPPTAEEVQKFQKAPTSANWKELVDLYLSSPAHAERLTMWWMDAARYSDTDGFQQDKERENWPYRDWVIKAFHENVPYDQFTREQFAGDLLPDASESQIIATAFHRNHMTNGEGGRDPEESRIDYVMDRVATTGTVWLGLSLGCAQCHTHKFDPVSHRDYYQMFAFFNSIDEDGRAGRGAKPYHKTTSPHLQPALDELSAEAEKWQKRVTLAHQEARKRFDQQLPSLVTSLPLDYTPWSRAQATRVSSAQGTTLKIEANGIIRAEGKNPFQDDYEIHFAANDLPKTITGWRIEVLPSQREDGQRVYGRDQSGNFILTNVKAFVRKDGGRQLNPIKHETAIATSEKDTQKKGRSYGKISETLGDDPRIGWTLPSPLPAENPTGLFTFAQPVSPGASDEVVIQLMHRSTYGNANLSRFRITLTGEHGEALSSFELSPKEELARSQAKNVDQLESSLVERLFEQHLLEDKAYQKVKAHHATIVNQRTTLDKTYKELEVMVLKERDEPRVSHILERGVWDAKGEEVSPAPLQAILPVENGSVTDRLGLANWLTHKDNPLTPRVTVNHLWTIVFGKGLVRTNEDFGLQGEAPTHPKLLDWLAVELVESGWDLRHILGLMVSSETFQQRSHVTPEMLELDPENRLLARANRYRLPAWMIRDYALRVSGLLTERAYGPPMKPWQPKGVWTEMSMGRLNYVPTYGADQYRRTLYAFWRRSSGPTFLFDNAKRRDCEVSQSITNTPLQALTLLNDESIRESARALADQNRQAPRGLKTLAEQILFRPPTDQEISYLTNHYKKTLLHYQSAPADALDLTAVGQQEPPAIADAAQTAALMTTATLLLNLDETITHE